jgi:hypothetical protein
MEPFENDELTESELDRLLEGWTAPEAPARLRASIFPRASAPWWKRLWMASFRIPVPVACILLLALAVAVWRVAKPPAVPRAASSFDIQGLKPVAELRPRIIRSGDAKN